MTTLATVTDTHPVPALGEIAILRQRQSYLLAALELAGRSRPADALREITDELTGIETNLQRYDGGMEEADHAEEIEFARMGY